MSQSNNDSNAGNQQRRGGLKGIYELAKPALHLSADQESKIEAALNELKEERHNLKTSGDGNVNMHAARKDARQKIMSILTPGQKTIWQDNLDKGKEDAE